MGVLSKGTHAIVQTKEVKYALSGHRLSYDGSSLRTLQSLQSTG